MFRSTADALVLAVLLVLVTSAGAVLLRLSSLAYLARRPGPGGRRTS
jgi:hypothetical protein